MTDIDDNKMSFDPNRFQTHTTFLDDIMKSEEERKKEMFGLDRNQTITNALICPQIDLGTYPDRITTPNVLETNIHDISNMEIIVKPTIEEELSKIQEELSKLNKVNNKLRIERKVDQAENAILREENKQLKAKLKRAKAKTKTKYDEDKMKRLGDELRKYQSETDDLQIRMNTVEDDLHVKKECR